MTRFLCWIVTLGFALCLLQGCALSNLAVEDLPINAARNPPSETPVPVFEAGLSRPTRAGIPVARIGAHGNGYANKQYLMRMMGSRGARIGADFVVMHGTEVRQGPTVTSFGSYSAISSTVQTLSAYGVAYVYSPVRIGAGWDDKYVVNDVLPDSPAAKAGVRIGDRILSVNGRRVLGDQLAVFHVLAASSPGDTIEMELVDPSNNQRVVRMIAAPNP